VLRRIFGFKRDEMAGGWRKLRNEEFHNLYSSPNIVTMISSRRVPWAGHVARMREIKSCIQNFDWKSWRVKPLGRPRRKWEGNIKIELREI
jgi:hypothetical protein